MNVTAGSIVINWNEILLYKLDGFLDVYASLYRVQSELSGKIGFNIK